MPAWTAWKIPPKLSTNINIFEILSLVFRVSKALIIKHLISATKKPYKEISKTNLDLLEKPRKWWISYLPPLQWKYLDRPVDLIEFQKWFWKLRKRIFITLAKNCFTDLSPTRMMGLPKRCCQPQKSNFDSKKAMLTALKNENFPLFFIFRDSYILHYILLSKLKRLAIFHPFNL